jgi:hypothetical protein
VVNASVVEYVLACIPGGDVDNALKIGHLFRRYLISASAPLLAPNGVFELPWLVAGKVQYLCRAPDCVCANARALFWFGGVNRQGRVGLHRPHTEDPVSEIYPQPKPLLLTVGCSMLFRVRSLSGTLYQLWFASAR